MKIKKFNFNYELELFEITHNPHKINSRLDHFIPWYAKSHETFIHCQKYNDEFLKYIVKKTGKTLGKLMTFSSVPEQHKIKNIWGEISLFAKKINSRFMSLEVAQELELFAPSILVNSISELEDYIKKNPQKNYVVKDECSVAGRGTRILKETATRGLNYPIRIEPLYERVHDIGVSAVFSDNDYQIKGYLKNKINASFGICGGIFYHDVDAFFRDYKIDDALKTQFVETARKILNYYLKLGVKGDFEFDNFFYLNQKNELALYPLVEVNYRKTMALFLMMFREYDCEYSYIEWIRVGLHQSLNYKKIDELDHPKIFVMGPSGGHNVDIFLCTSDIHEAHSLKKMLLGHPWVKCIYQ